MLDQIKQEKLRSDQTRLVCIERYIDKQVKNGKTTKKNNPQKPQNPGWKT